MQDLGVLSLFCIPLVDETLGGHSPQFCQYEARTYFQLR